MFALHISVRMYLLKVEETIVSGLLFCVYDLQMLCVMSGSQLLDKRLNEDSLQRIVDLFFDHNF